MLAVEHGHERVVELLLRHGAEVNLQDSGGGTALMYAAHQGHERLVEVLLRHGAAVNLQSRNGRTALVAAAPGVSMGVSVCERVRLCFISRVNLCKRCR